MNKAVRIRELHAQGHTTREIAALVLGLADGAPHKEADRKMAYVRAAIKRGLGPDKAQERYLMRKWGGASAREAIRNQWRLDPTYREAKIQSNEQWFIRRYGGASLAEAARNARQTDPDFAARHRVACQRYRRRRRNGATADAAFSP